MKENKGVTPFSNGSEAEYWISNNCDICKRYGCSSKKAIEISFFTGVVSIRTYHLVGEFSKYCIKLLRTPIQKVNKKKNKIDSNQTRIDL